MSAWTWKRQGPLLVSVVADEPLVAVVDAGDDRRVRFGTVPDNHKPARTTTALLINENSVCPYRDASHRQVS